METITLIKVFSALLFVVSLFLASAWILKKYLNVYGIAAPKHNHVLVNHLAIVDAKRRLVEIVYEDKKFLLLIGNNDLVLDVKNTKLTES